jgi:hypothetical protein
MFRTSIHELMKTPSKTQTVRNTRALTTAAKDRTEKVKRLNAVSPSHKASPVSLDSSLCQEADVADGFRVEYHSHHYNLDL